MMTLEMPAILQDGRLIVGRFAMIYHRDGCDMICSSPHFQMPIPEDWERLRSDGQWLIMRPPGPFLGRVSARRCLEPCRHCLPELRRRSPS